MSAAATRDRVEAGQIPERALSDRLLAAAPVASVFVWLLLVYAWEAWAHATPWLFTDELELTQLARSIAAHGFPAHRREDTHSWRSLYTLLTVPAWWLHSSQAAYDTVKYLNSVLMASTVFPVYGLARMLVSRWPALFAAAAAAAIPSVAYSSLVVEENLAYPYSALCLFLMAKALVTRRRGWLAAAIVASLVAPLVRRELAVLPVALALATALTIWSSPRMRARRVDWTLGDYVGGLTLIAGAIFWAGGVASHHSWSWYVATYLYEGRMLQMGLWAAGALTIGLGVLPVVAGLATLWRPRDEPVTTELRVFRAVLFASIVCYGMYTAIKAAYLSTVFATRVEERNLIYLAPPLLVATALWVERRRISVLPVLAAGAFAGYLLASTPYLLDSHLYSDALGVAILERANRVPFRWNDHDAAVALFTILGVSLAALLATSLGRVRARPRLTGGIAAVAAVFALAWGFTGELSAADASNSFSSEFAANLGRPFDWVDQATGGASTLYLGEQVADQNAEWGMEFWNRSIQHVWSLDRSTEDSGPGLSITPNILLDGGIEPDPHVGYAVEEPGIEIAGTVVATHDYSQAGKTRTWRLVRVSEPLRLDGATFGLYADGWSGTAESSYMRFGSRTRGGTMVVTVSRAEGGPDEATPIDVRLGTVVINKTNDYPSLGRILKDFPRTLQPHGTITVRIPTTLRRFRVETIVTNKFVPAEIDPHSSDRRTLGAVVTYHFEPAKG